MLQALGEKKYFKYKTVLNKLPTDKATKKGCIFSGWWLGDEWSIDLGQFYI